MSDPAAAYDEPHPTDGETPEERRERIARERAMLAEGEAELRAGRGIPLEVVEAWLDRLEEDPDAPLPIADPASQPAA